MDKRTVFDPMPPSPPASTRAFPNGDPDVPFPYQIGPDYQGGGLVNLIAELEAQLGGSPPSPRLTLPLPTAGGYVLLLVDGLGSHQLEHRAAAALASAHVRDLEAPFPTTTTVSLATLATGVTPSRHGLVGYQLLLDDVVANTIKWTTLWGDPLKVDHQRFLPETTWERLASRGIETVVVQPAAFEGSGLTRTVYRGARFEGARTTEEWLEATLALAQPGRLVVAYLPHVDVAAHMTGQGSREYEEALSMVATLWSRLEAGTDRNVCLLGTADHGHIDIPANRQILLARTDQENRILYGDSRVMFIKGEAPEGDLPATYFSVDELGPLWGPGPHLRPERVPDGILVADPGYALMHRYSDTRMIGHHGGLTEEERLVPLLVRE